MFSHAAIIALEELRVFCKSFGVLCMTLLNNINQVFLILCFLCGVVKLSTYETRIGKATLALFG
jgi:hypothetical protein